MTDNETEVRAVYLQPGEVYIARSPTFIKTILGSCVGVTFWSQRLGIGALCHGVLPKHPAGVPPRQGYHYVDFVIRHLARRFEGFGVRSGELEVKVFGGADVLPVPTNASTRATVGRQNWETALETLHDERLDVIASDLGGSVGRTIEFNTQTGEVLLRRLSPLEEDSDSTIGEC